ncbi:MULTISPECIES: fimbrial protein [Pseudomonas]|jgi:major type 1 subunit fimbrin (pilin)|uniref:Type 1 fimbrial protein n=2 Tax=Pseudomonas TaxID=286 RepID=A0A9Q5FSA3_PSEFR|nr:fimbrial protein [Pseudomonas fragi]ARQ76171.1 fimbrial protein [Pseudomonas fragi]MBM1200982.1 type 1 fimbrial protein [Pseudomonas fragi]MBM1204272.1 type 1 fimbrial protein [Pseudomonas fragi]MDE4514507.1 type 1 fimbrial protein [Pseudomonas fragi]NNA87079.1 type 1 fimbrial protein [Pseudomonas fragi]
MFQKIGKYTALCGSSLLIVMAAATAQAADGQVEFTGTINDNACTINSESVKKAVDMGQVRIADFPNTVGAVATAGATPFSISLENCSGSTLKNASIKFSGQQSGTDATVLGMTGDNQVSGVGIQINDARTGNKLPLNTASNDYVLRPQSNTFDFTASYVRLVADTEASGDTPGVRGIGTGKVNALASFDVTYK